MVRAFPSFVFRGQSVYIRTHEHFYVAFYPTVPFHLNQLSLPYNLCLALARVFVVLALSLPLPTIKSIIIFIKQSVISTFLLPRTPSSPQQTRNNPHSS
jgi:hypothetical protein